MYTCFEDKYIHFITKFQNGINRLSLRWSDEVDSKEDLEAIIKAEAWKVITQKPGSSLAYLWITVRNKIYHYITDNKERKLEFVENVKETQINTMESNLTKIRYYLVDENNQKDVRNEIGSLPTNILIDLLLEHRKLHYVRRKYGLTKRQIAEQLLLAKQHLQKYIEI